MQLPPRPLLIGAVLAAALGIAVALRVHDRDHAADTARRQALSHRHDLQRRLESAITVYARRQVVAHKLDGPILHTSCQAFEGTNPADVGLRRARYSCNAVTLQTAQSSIGHLFVGEIDFATERIRFHRKGIPIWLGI
jgi:hypothetical protein